MHSLILKPTSAGLPNFDRATALRTFGHFLLSVVPVEGLPEAIEGLGDTYMYWLSRANEITETNEQRSTFYDAKQGSSYERPVFHATNE